MTPAQLSRVKDLLMESIDWSPAERPERLADRCEDPVVRAEVLRLLEGPEPGGWLSEPGREETASIQAESMGSASRPRGLIARLVDDLGPGDRIGPYHLIRVRGEGGMGVVWEAEQTEPVQRRVALKLVRHGRDSKRLIERFESERQALAVMSHPYVARVFDAGATESGRPYFVMELVAGDPITRLCDRRHLTIDQRLRLFQDVCEAIHHAHQRGLIHRDVKPSNILVEEQGDRLVPKVIDFGIARAIEDEGWDADGEVALGTPSYMSPEQADPASGPADTRSDVYGLGALLYELLCGTPPVRAADLSDTKPEDLRQRLLQIEPPPPSERLRWTAEEPEAARKVAEARATTGGRLRRRVRGDLDWIVMRALRKSPDERYASVSELAADIQRHQRMEPVEAAQRRFSYRFGRWVRRHAYAATAATVVLGTLLVATAISSTALIQARRAERVARDEGESARRVADFMTELFAVSDPSNARGNSVTAREILDRGADRIREGLTDEPQVRARLLLTMGRVYHGLGLYPPSESLMRDAVAQAETLGENQPILGETLLWLGWHLGNTGRRDEAEPMVRRARRLLERTVGTDDVRYARSCTVLGDVLRFNGNMTEPGPLYEQALAIQERDLGPDHVDTAFTLYSLAWYRSQLGDVDGAIELYERLVPAFEKGLGDDAPMVAWAHSDFASVLGQAKRYEEARPHLDRALEIQQHVLGPEHPHVAVTWNKRGVLHYYRGEFETAESDLRRALEIQEATPDANAREHVSTLTNLGLVLFNGGDPEAAARYYRAAIRSAEERLGMQHPSVAQASINLAIITRTRGGPVEAFPLEDRALAIWRGMYEGGHASIAQAMAQRALTLSIARRWAEARQEIESAIAMHPSMENAGNYVILAEIQLEQDDLDGARESVQKALARAAEQEGEWRRVTPLAIAAVVDVRQGKLEAALKKLDEADALDGGKLSRKRARESRARLELARGNPGRAREILTEVLKEDEEHYGRQAAVLIQTLALCADVSLALGDSDRALAELERAHRITRLRVGDESSAERWFADRLVAAREAGAGRGSDGQPSD